MAAFQALYAQDGSRVLVSPPHVEYQRALHREREMSHNERVRHRHSHRNADEGRG